MLDFFNQTVGCPNQMLVCLYKVVPDFDRVVDCFNETVENLFQMVVCCNQALFRLYELVFGFKKEIVEPAKILAQAEG